jgi:hypothetical protein
MVATSGTPSTSASAIAGWATSQSWACTTSGRQDGASRVSAARSIPWPIASAHATRSRSNSRCGGSSATRSTRTPSRTSSVVGCVSASLPAGCRESTTTSCPAAASSVARACTCRPRPPTTTGGYSQETISTRTGGTYRSVAEAGDHHVRTPESPCQNVGLACDPTGAWRVRHLGRVSPTIRPGESGISTR